MKTADGQIQAIERSPEQFEQLVIENLYHMHGQALPSATLRDAYMALAYTIRDFLIERWRKTNEAYYEANPKFVYYLSAEYLPGKQLPQNMLYTETMDLVRQALARYPFDMEEIVNLDAEPGLGNGGLGRLAACFLDSLATLGIPAVGYGLRYEFGIFEQAFEDGQQIERPDKWLMYGNPWEFVQSDEMVHVGFGGWSEHYRDGQGNLRIRWLPDQHVLGEPCTMLVPGFGNQTVNMLRLWRARATEEFDFQLFDVGDYVRAVEQKIKSENISKVLYPNDETIQGKYLRLQQQYFFVACSLWDIIRRFRLRNKDWDRFPDQVAIQLNDTHPVVAIPELMRVLMDDHLLDWEHAWDIVRRTFNYTCHTLLPEAMERWPVDLFGSMLPRHLEIVYEINRRFLDQVRRRYPGDEERIIRMSLIEEGTPRQIRMAHLGTVGSAKVNGVAQLQSQLLQEHALRDFAEMWPDRFQNKTNGVTPRRFMRLANPRLCDLIASKIGDGWLNEMDRLRELEAYADEPSFQQQWRMVKQHNKRHLAQLLQQRDGLMLDPHAVLDVMVKRLHEYKRQLLKTLHIIWLYQQVKSFPNQDVIPRTFLFGAKAAPGYRMAKLIIRLIHGVAEVVNSDPDVRGRLRVVFPPNFNVSLAERIYPAADISEQISMAGKEASGTGNMKFALNGALTVGTLDGANVEIRDRVGVENFFLFGLTADQVMTTKANGYLPQQIYHDNAALRSVIDAIASGAFSSGDENVFRPIVASLLRYDEYLLLADFASYIECSEQAAAAYRDQNRWTRMSIMNTARCGFFSSDRTIAEYCQDIWNISPVEVPC